MSGIQSYWTRLNSLLDTVIELRALMDTAAVQGIDSKIDPDAKDRLKHILDVFRDSIRSERLARTVVELGDNLAPNVREIFKKVI